VWCCFLLTHLWFGCDFKGKAIISSCWTTQIFFAMT
jgi:hypothetical protein